MKRIIILIPFLLAVSASAQVPVSFEASLGSVRQRILAVRAEQLGTKNASLAADIRRLQNTAQRLRGELSLTRSELMRLSSRVRNAQAPAPGQPSDGSLRYDVQRFNYFLRDTARKAQDLSYDMRRINNAVTDKDPELAAPAQALASETRWLRNDLIWIGNDARSLAWDLRRIQMQMEAFDVERESRELDTQITQADMDAQRLLDKVR